MYKEEVLYKLHVPLMVIFQRAPHKKAKNRPWKKFSTVICIIDVQFAYKHLPGIFMPQPFL
jgi:hypothetical protein